MMDLVNFRKYIGTKKKPRAVHNTRSGRIAILVADLPIDSTLFSNLSRTNSQVEGWYKIGDIFVLEDGIFLGREWTGGGLLRLA